MPRRSPSPPADTTSRGDGAEHGYRRDLRALQIELVKFQRRLIAKGYRILVLFEGRDAAGKDGMIKHIVEHLSPR
jgi:polyphosphate kinase 2 (PPK2 family)